LRVLIFHGYLLRGTGSNVYNANLAAALVGLGHDVHLLCQERHAADLEFVAAVGDWDAGSLRVTAIRSSGCTVYRPDIGAVLPVYVRDRYEGIDARTFPDLSDEEVRAYVQANVDAVAQVASRARPHVALANHLIMGPAILARALAGNELPYAVVIHGSALEYTVKPYPRFLGWAREGLAPAKGILVSSRHTAESLWTALSDPSLPPRTRLVAPGVDIDKFRPLPREIARARLPALAEQLRSARPVSRQGAPEPASDFERDDGETAAALRALARWPPEAPLVAFVGKLILAKGIDLLALAWPLVLTEIPEATLVVAGFGSWRAGMERLLALLQGGRLQAARELLASGRFAVAFLDSLGRSGALEAYLDAAAGLGERVVFTGRLEHDELAALLCLCEATVVPSTFPEAFGMVAAEAAACGALPISAAHSGLGEVSRRLAVSLPEPVRELVSFPLRGDVVREIAVRLIRWLRAPAPLRAQARTALARAAAEHYSWESVARAVIAAASGQLERLAPAGRLGPADGE
jgi:glycosyltransferase involved in cell wall biosynthesis